MAEIKIIGVDLALRNSAIVVLNSDYSFNSCKVVTSDYTGEDLLIHNKNEVSSLIDDKENTIVFIEALSFNSASSTRDIMSGNFWYVKASLYEYGIETYSIEPASWRSKVFTKEVKEWSKDLRKELRDSGIKGVRYKQVLKDAALKMVPDDVQILFKEYLTTNKIYAKFIYDLADAYCIATHGVNTYHEFRKS